MFGLAAAACSSKTDNAATGDTAAATTAAPAAGETTAPAATTGGTDAAATTTAAVATTVDALGAANAATGAPIKLGYVTDGEASFGSDKDEVEVFEATVRYANEHLGGLNGHEIQLEHCTTDNTPAGGTQCAVDLTKAGVAAVLVPVSAQDGAIFDGLAGSGIPYFTYNSASQSILFKPGAFLITNPVSTIAVPGIQAKEQGLKKVGFILIDVPAATGPITAIAQPIFAKLGVELQIIPISPSVADMTPQLQEAISGGADFFTVTGTDDFNISGYNGLRQLGFTGPVLIGAAPKKVLDSLSTLDNLVGTGVKTDAADDKDVQLLDAVVKGYTDLNPDEMNGNAGNGFATVIGFIRALAGATDAVDAATISTALEAMKAPADLPLGGGITFQCGTHPVSFAPSICSTDVLSWTYNADGSRKDFGLVTVPGEVLTLG